VHRSHRAFNEASERLIVEFGRLVLLGSEDATEAAYQVGLALGEMAKSLPTVNLGPPHWMPISWWPVKRERIQADDRFRERVQVATKALREFLLTARIDLSAT
jgi:hypothetical protein